MFDHAEEARRVSEIAAGSYGQIEVRNGDMAVALQIEAQTQAILAQAHATLALVEQQRTANLVALMASAAQGVANMTMHRDDYMEMFHRINPRIVSSLGIEGDSNEP